MTVIYNCFDVLCSDRLSHSLLWCVVATQIEILVGVLWIGSIINFGPYSLRVKLGDKVKEGSWCSL